MFRGFVFFICCLLMFASCNNSNTNKELSEREKTVRDSVSKVNQKRIVDSLKKLNPLLIMPPDSNFSGDYIDKYPNGIIMYRGLFRFGQRHGQWVSFYSNGNPWSEQHYDKGKRQGANVVYYENAKIRYKGYYKNDKRDSVWMFYDTSGILLKTVIYKEDKEIANK